MPRTKEAAKQPRRKVIAAALELFSRNGYSNTTLAMIAQAAGFSRGPIYWHFKNKDELYQAVLTFSQEPLERLIERSRKLGADPLAAIGHFVREWFRLLLEDRWYRQSFEILLNKTELTAQMASLMGITHTWLFSPKLFSLREQAEQLGDGLMELLAARPSEQT